MKIKARDIRRGDWVIPNGIIGDVGKGWKVAAVKVRGEDVLVDVEGRSGTTVHSVPVMGEDDMVEVTRS